jgi:hypothetical protein
MIHFTTSSIFVFGVGIYCLVRGILALKREARRDAGLLFIFMASCAFIISLLGMIARALKGSRQSEVMINKITLVVVGMWLGILFIMTIFGHLSYRKKTDNPPDRDPHEGDGAE